MCGIVAYVGHRDAAPLILKGLKRLEYRGYDSAGIALLNGALNVYKKKGKVKDLEEAITNETLQSTIGIGHTRWATHGEPNDRNAHPHYSASRNLAIIHNGIIENYSSIKKNLMKKGHEFHSDTDSEVFVHFIEDIQINAGCSLEEAVRLAMKEVVGAYAIVVMDATNPTQLIAARKGSPLVIGVGEKEFFFASDATPIIEYTHEMIYLNDYEIAVVRDGELTVKNIDNALQSPYIQTVELELEAIEKGGYEHFMLKEIFEQPRSVADCLRGRVNADNGHLVLGGLREYTDKLAKAKRIVIVACGTSWHAGLVAEYLFEELARINVEVEYASEFRYRNPIIKEGDFVIAISQSGETADTLAAIELAKSKGATIIGVCNVVGSSIPRATHAGAYTHAGPEIGVASTKAFTAQVIVLTQMAIAVARKKGTLHEDTFRRLLFELERIPHKIETVLQSDSKIKEIAEKFKDARNFIYLGRGYNFPVALEGALKLKEISYIHAEGYPAAEMKHGPIALIDAEMPVVFIATKDSSYDKVVSNIQEVKARKGQVIAIVTEGDKLIPTMADYVVEIPAMHEALIPLVSVIPLQLLSYHIAVMRGCNVDQPRNLAKSVTVE
ncbi:MULTISPECIES: glutamine--fructose-6-phosphate transaminase (isomerizing) [Flectobacillus]|jgi:glucosamine--fructose-6-phosphate aminotransferase (isomerizing)|uniref:Glutamine--fructose-6-phosphate aminotransferase [isomerizing] n=1 Tax=Flectobacillus roseus TaxID=502259 RepID=A0ABT6Y5K1_9BACT|nr:MULTISPECIES: glutamine--fructose-6-phosphate transaminase (isomerizing) [Flectobacillus]MDI9858822.1 glutamine--fructose-6-phosphate transaminase (isomerizing) [Flectobacillus roseus]NBA78664.1 glutamine--fructose-6-phosphate transaminase (isomerizing) [Emticicia sp. ODNR4P]PAC27909.1 glutamine--fructose-6-phosphate transaminase (isomerizing) [Flectobacillus sp. BAB-3569]